MRLWDRKVRVQLSGGSGLLINGNSGNEADLKVAFSVERTISSSANEGTIRIWNLSEGTRRGVGRELTDVRLEAGYLGLGGEGDNIGVIGAGQIRDVSHERENADIITTLTLGDGDRALRRASVSKSYDKNTNPEDVFRDAASRLEPFGVTLGEMRFPTDVQPFLRPYAMAGAARREMERLGRRLGIHWSIQNGVLEAVPGDEALNGVVSFGPDSGLIGVPTLTDNGVSAKVLLNPGIRPGRQARIASDLMTLPSDGLIRVSEVRFEGDNYDGDFVAQIEGETISGGKVDEGPDRTDRALAGEVNAAQVAQLRDVLAGGIDPRTAAARLGAPLAAVQAVLTGTIWQGKDG